MAGAIWAKGSEQRPWERFFGGQKPEVHVKPLEYTDLKNGIRVYFKENSFAPKATLKIFIKGGTYEEPDEKLGLTALWGNSLTYSGSQSHPRDELAGYLEMRATDFVFASGLERAAFSVSALSPYLLEDWQIIWDVLKNPRFAAEDVALIKEMKLQKIRRRNEKPSKMAYDGAKRVLWHDNLRSKMATIQTVSSISVDDLKNWHKVALSAGRISVLVSGDFDRGALLQAFESTLGSLSSGVKADSSRLEVKKVPQRPRHIYLQEKAIPQTTLVWRAPGIVHRSKDYYALKLYDFILGGSSFNSYLTGEIRTKRGWAYAVYSHYSSGAHTGDLTIFLQTQNQNATAAVQLMNELLASPEKFLTEEKLAAAKLSLANRFVFLFETPEKLAELQLSLSWDELPDDYLNTFLVEIDKVTLEDLYRIAKTYYHPDRFFLSAVGPVEALDPAKVKAAGYKKIEKIKLPVE